MNHTETVPSIRSGIGISMPHRDLRKFLDTAREAIIVVDQDMRIAENNRVAAEIFSSIEDGNTRRLSEVIRDLDLHEAFRRASASGRTTDVKLDFGGLERRKFDVHVTPIELEGETYGIGFFYETTNLERLEIVRQEFLSNISHELRTPLTSILAFVETLEDGAINDEENNRRFLAVIRRNAERMHSLIADILELSMIESGKISVEKRHVRLYEPVEEIFASLASKAADREVRLFNDIPKASLIDVDPVRLEQMLTNLIDNAIKFNRIGGSVTVSLEVVKGKDIISVADSGEGIMHEHLDRIFERFYRVDRARSREMGGTGLGLAIVKHLAKLNGGEVGVRSILSEGTIFRIELPAIDSDLHPS